MPTAAERQEALIRNFGVVHAYDPDDGIFVVSPDRLGFGAIMPPLNGIDTATLEALNVLLNVPYPTNSTLQVLHYASPDIEPVIWDFKELRRNETDPNLNKISDERVNFLRGLTLNAASEQMQKFALRCTHHLLRQIHSRAGKTWMRTASHCAPPTSRHTCPIACRGGG